jgi:hypothetical protein
MSEDQTPLAPLPSSLPLVGLDVNDPGEFFTSCGTDFKKKKNVNTQCAADALSKEMLRSLERIAQLLEQQEPQQPGKAKTPLAKFQGRLNANIGYGFYVSI